MIISLDFFAQLDGLCLCLPRGGTGWRGEGVAARSLKSTSRGGLGGSLGKGLRARSHLQALLRGCSCLEQGKEGEARAKKRFSLATVTVLPGLRGSMERTASPLCIFSVLQTLPRRTPYLRVPSGVRASLSAPPSHPSAFWYPLCLLGHRLQTTKSPLMPRLKGLGNRFQFLMRRPAGSHCKGKGNREERITVVFC